MSQPIQPEQWVEALDQNRLLPWRVTNDIFTGQGIQIANNADTLHGIGKVVRIWDFNISDYITVPDARRLNGLAGTNTEGRDGWGASYYGTFQDVRFTHRTYTIGRKRSSAWRLWDVETYDGPIGYYGDAATSSISTIGQSLMKTAAIMQKTLNLWKQQVLGPDIDKYNLFAVMNGHMSGLWVDDEPDKIFTGNGTWVAQPGTVTGTANPPRFAAIHCVEWDDSNIPLLLQNLKITWNNLFIPQDNRVILIDPYYEYRLLAALTGKGVPATEAAYSDIQNGSFTRLMGWEFRFDIPTQYWPRLYVDDNLNVVHSPDGTAAYDLVINSIDGGSNPDLKLQNQLAAADRMTRLNFVRTDWDAATGKFVKTVTNYPLGQPGAVPYLGIGETVATPINDPAEPYPWTNPNFGYGLDNPTGPVSPIVRRQVIGLALYKPAAQLSQEYSAVVNDVGVTRGPFTEMCTEVCYDAWVIETLSHGIIPIIDASANTGTFAIPIEEITPNTDPTAVTGVTALPATMSLKVGEQALAEVTVSGTGKYDMGWTAVSDTPANATVNSDGVITAIKAGTANITYTAIGDNSKSATVAVTVTA